MSTGPRARRDPFTEVRAAADTWLTLPQLAKAAGVEEARARRLMEAAQVTARPTPGRPRAEQVGKWPPATAVTLALVAALEELRVPVATLRIAARWARMADPWAMVNNCVVVVRGAQPVLVSRARVGGIVAGRAAWVVDLGRGNVYNPLTPPPAGDVDPETDDEE